MSHLKPTADESQGLQTEAVWSMLGRQVDALLASWSRGEPPPLARFLPGGPPRVRRLVLMELLKVDLEQRYSKPDQRRRIEDYAAEFEELSALSAIPVDLIYEEFQIRRQAGDEPDPQEYFERFPQQAGELIALLGLDSPYQTTTRFGREQLEQIEIGQRIDDFDLLVRLGRGAFATVFLARQRSLGRLVALKVSANRSSEPQTLAQLDHPFIVRVFDQRLIPERRLRLLYMQYVPGGTLHPVVDAVRRTPATERRGSLLLDCIDRELVNRGEEPPRDSRARQQLAHAAWAQTVCWLGARLAFALEYAHQRGVLHRDVKPANVLLSADASPKLVDFNIAANSKLEGVSPAAYFGGSLAYMSPEQLEACNPAHERQPEDLDGRSDIYSLGILLWELLTGRRPFADQIEEDRQATLSEMTARRRGGIPTSAQEDLPRDCPAGLIEVLETCLAPEMDARYRQAGQLARQLELCLRPQTQRLLRPPARSWQQRMRSFTWALLALSVTGLAPNGLLSGFNISYNLSQIVQPLGPAARDGFFRQLVSVNASFYLGAFALGMWLSWPVLQGLRSSGGKVRAAGARAPLRRRSLVLGTYIGWITFALWVISGLVFPLVVQSYLEPGQWMHWSAWVHFMGSQMLCGMLAATLVFFSMTFFCVRTIYPALLRGEDADESEVGPLARVVRRARWQVGVAVSVPLLAVLLLAVLVQDTHVNPTPAFGMLALLGLGGSLAALALQRLIAADAEALANASAPGGSAGLTSSDLVDSFWHT